MRITSWVVTLLAAAVLPALAQEETLKDIEHGAKKAGEKIKEGVETVAEKTKETGETVAKAAKKAWRETKAYASGNRATYRKGARQKLNELSREIADLKTRKSEAADPAAFDRQLETLSQQQATAKEQLDTMRKATSDQDYSEHASSSTPPSVKWRTASPRRENNYGLRSNLLGLSSGVGCRKLTHTSCKDWLGNATPHRTLDSEPRCQTRRLEVLLSHSKCVAAWTPLSVVGVLVGNHRRQSQQSRLELGLRLSRGLVMGEQSGLLTHIVATNKRFVARADEKLTAFVELETANHQSEFRAITPLGYSYVRAVCLSGCDQPSAAALEAGLMEQEQHYPCSAALP